MGYFLKTFYRAKQQNFVKVLIAKTNPFKNFICIQ